MGYEELLRRYEAGGLAGLADRSHRPVSCPHQMPLEVEERVVALRCAHPGWGPLRIVDRLAKEGAKLNIGIVYSTQSIESLSPDLLKNTENFFIAHLNDEREVKALTRFHEFRDVGADVQRTKSHGFVRMITRSHRFALPVQIRKFCADTP